MKKTREENLQLAKIAYKEIISAIRDAEKKYGAHIPHDPSSLMVGNNTFHEYELAEEEDDLSFCNSLDE